MASEVASHNLHTSSILSQMPRVNMPQTNGTTEPIEQNGLSKIAMGKTQIIKGDLATLSPKVQRYLLECVAVCRPDKVYICDGSEEENVELIRQMVAEGMMKKLPKYDNCWLTRTDPADVARVERLTFISTRNKKDTVAQPKAGVKGILGNWMSHEEMEQALASRFPGCMQGQWD